MIRKVTLKNFESHESSEIDFTEGLNLIIGQSNQGKSSIVRAIAMVVANRFTIESVRTGTEFCTVRIDTDKGFVQAERGESRNHWIVGTPDGQQKEYRNIGTTVPPEVPEILGMAERVRGDIKELPNIMFQLEKHYILSEIDGKKTTSNMIARMMDDAIGIGGLEELIKDIASDFATKKKELGTKNIQISEVRGKILDISIFESYQKSVEESRNLLREAESLNELLESAKSLSERLQKNRERFSQIKDYLVVSDGLEPLSDGLRKNLEHFKRISRAAQICRETQKLNSRLESSKPLTSLVKNVDSAIGKYKILVKARNTQARIQEITRRLSSSLPELDSQMEEYAKSLQNVTNAQKMLFDARTLYKKIRKISNDFISKESSLKDAESRLESLKKTLGNCPLCGGKL